MDEYKSYEIRYTFTSVFGSVDVDRYATNYEGKIYETDLNTGEETCIGKLKITLLLLEMAIKDEYDLEDIIDRSQTLWKVGKMILDLESGNLQKDILDYFDNAVPGSNVCILDRLELAESHRRKGIGRKVIRDVFVRFAHGCGLVTGILFPLEFEGRRSEVPESVFEKKMSELKKFHRGIGFHEIDGFEEMVFLCPASRNKKLEAVDHDGEG